MRGQSTLTVLRRCLAGHPLQWTCGSAPQAVLQSPSSHPLALALASSAHCQHHGSTCSCAKCATFSTACRHSARCADSPQPAMDAARHPLGVSSHPWSIQQVRRHSTQPDNPAPAGGDPELSDRHYHELADKTLDHLQEAIEVYLDEVDVDGSDVEYGQGVLTIKLGCHGTYVINKQSPNKQIWMSSPVSGPTRYDWREGAGWVYHRDGHELLERVGEEVSRLVGEKLELRNPHT